MAFGAYSLYPPRGIFFTIFSIFLEVQGHLLLILGVLGGPAVIYNQFLGSEISSAPFAAVYYWCGCLAWHLLFWVHIWCFSPLLFFLFYQGRVTLVDTLNSLAVLRHLLEAKISLGSITWLPFFLLGLFFSF